MADRKPLRSVLVIHDTPSDVQSMLAARFPDLEIFYAAAPQEVIPALESVHPQAVLSIKHSGFPGPAHRPAIDYPSVVWVHAGNSGYDHFVPFDQTRVHLTTSVGVLARFLAETAMAGILALNNNLLRFAHQQRERIWQPRTFRPLYGQVLLVVGLGAIGNFLAANARSLGMHVIGIRRHYTESLAAHECHPPEALPELVGRADVVSLHVRLNEETEGMVDAALLRALKPGAILVNTSRGRVVEESALIDALREGRLAGAYLDVFEQEPLPPGSPLWSMPNVLVSPHTSDNVVDWPQRMAGLFADNIDRWRSGKPLLNEIQLPPASSAVQERRVLNV
ncbi:MAG: D-2-hydroxyacid dehydrogenase [Acetobacteraceae bacterium]